VNHELERIGKEAFVAKFKVLSPHLHRVSEKNISGYPEDGGSTLIINDDICFPSYTASHSGKR
jgi:hypothetical protein